MIVNNYKHFNELYLALGLIEERVFDVSFIDKITWLFRFGSNSAYNRMYFYPVLAVLCLVLVYWYPKIKNFKQSYILFLGGWIGMIVIGRMNEHYLLLQVTFLYPILIHSAVQLRNKLSILYLISAIVMFLGIQGYIFKINWGADIYAYREKVLGAVEVPNDVVLIAPDDLWFFYKQHNFHGYHTRSNIDYLIEGNLRFRRSYPLYLKKRSSEKYILRILNLSHYGAIVFFCGFKCF